MIRPVLVVAIASLLVASTGCHKPAEPIHQTAALVTIPDATEYDRLWADAVAVLRRYEMTPDRQDRAAGLITTRPVTSAHWFEFWRQDVTTSYAFAESNLANVRRAAEVEIDPTDQTGEYVLAVRVNIERLSSPERQVSSSAGAYQMFGSKLPTTTGELLRGRSPDRWVPQGRDAELEATILARIIDRNRPATFEYVEYETDAGATPDAATGASGESGGDDPDAESITLPDEPPDDTPAP